MGVHGEVLFGLDFRCSEVLDVDFVLNAKFLDDNQRSSGRIVEDVVQRRLVLGILFGGGIGNFHSLRNGVDSVSVGSLLDALLLLGLSN